jgi:hypothetical protein
MLDLVFFYITDLHIAFPDTGIIKPAVYHPPLSIEMPLFLKRSKTSEYSYSKYTCSDYTLLYHIVSSYDWSYVYSKLSVGAVVASLNSAVHER